MNDLHHPRHRRPQEGVLANRQAMLLLRPFVSRFEGWNLRAARASATISSRATTPGEKAEQYEELDSLRREVEAAHRDFHAATAGHSSHGRLTDVEAAFERLISHLKRATR